MVLTYTASPLIFLLMLMLELMLVLVIIHETAGAPKARKELPGRAITFSSSLQSKISCSADS